MPIRFSIYPIGQLVTYTVEGAATADEVREFLDAVFADRRFRRGFDFLGDIAGDAAEPDAAYTTAVGGEVLARLARLRPCRWAVIVPSRAGYEMVLARVVPACAGGVEVAPFPNWDEAMGWLGADRAGVAAVGPLTELPG
jgi:hypothetical protein